ncbi:MAG: tetratricopeptide repeat protein [Planctomycetes bacterium]|nr:tetratricopeptide repeat protein [Planctomycetota bacterium]
MPRSTAPQLTTRRPATSVVAGATAGVRQPYWTPRPAYPACNPVTWYGWWNPCYGPYSHWNACTPWYGGFGVGAWSAWLWAPWYCYRASWWNACYASSWYWNWSTPYGVAASYWWYPTTTYCPVYLQVPSSTVVIETAGGAAAGETIVAGGPSAGETIVAGGPAIARGPATAGAAPTAELPPDAVAGKYVELGRLYFHSGRYAESAEAYGRARSQTPDDGPLHFELADAAFANGDYHYAAFLIAEALRLAPELATIDVDKRTFYGDAKAFETQMEALDRYLGSRPFDAQAHLVRGYNLRFSGEPVAAIAAFRRVLEITPENRAAQAFLAALESAAPTTRGR